MILLCGIPSEAPLRLVRQAAERLGVEAVLFNQRLSSGIKLDGQVSSLPGKGFTLDGTLTTQEHVHPLDVFSGVYVRLMDYQALPEFDGAAAAHITRLHTALINWLEVGELRVMNRLGAMGSNQSKPYQAQLIAEAGFLTPPTLITNDPAAVSEFLFQHGRVIYKSISAVRSVVQELTRSRLQALGKIRYLPVQFQAFIPGDNLRVHVAGKQVFATLLHSDAVDYRYAGHAGLDLAMESVEIEEEVKQRCRRLSRRLGLPLCGIDLKRTPEGAYYCFEVNPSPAFSFYQENTGQDIAEAIVRWLAALL